MSYDSECDTIYSLSLLVRFKITWHMTFCYKKLHVQTSEMNVQCFLPLLLFFFYLLSLFSFLFPAEFESRLSNF